MSREAAILTIAWILTTVMLFLYIPKNRLREAALIFLFKQMLTWILGLTIVQFGLIEYPVRLFSHANKASFTFEYFIYPSICVIFNLHYPEGKRFLIQLMHYIYYCSAMTAIEAMLERYTNIINYIHWTWYLTWISLFMTFFISRQFYLWFFRIKGKNLNLKRA